MSMDLIIEPILREYCDFSKMILTASGREDIDVRMLGEGRPFIL